ncbi:hypothetical protein AVEN_235383-1 [Araneus ventricosus]|uniref:Uncharacterized protein n=1 Tax=Araneus ventricosus TaxID=182803 RepID=A0A4Y2A3S3_ARAVE|nr:hypothetical protein AVEN_235383-1 [Araneus ventricosus]
MLTKNRSTDSKEDIVKRLKIKRLSSCGKLESVPEAGTDSSSPTNDGNQFNHRTGRLEADLRRGHWEGIDILRSEGQSASAKKGTRKSCLRARRCSPGHNLQGDLATKSWIH